MIEWIKIVEFNSETWIAIASAITAICALAATIWQGRQNYKHNKLSVRPMLTTMINYKDGKKTRTVSFELINSGFGPAIIKDFILMFDGEEVSKNNLKSYEDFLKEKAKSFKVESVFSITPDASIVMGERYELFSFSYKHGEDVSFIHKLDLLVNYQSIYEDEIFTHDTRKHRKYHGDEVTI